MATTRKTRRHDRSGGGGVTLIDEYRTRPGGPNRQERAHRVGAAESLTNTIKETGMLQVRTCVSVHCHQCGDALGAPGFEAHYPSEDVALQVAAARGWRIGPGDRLYCSACGPVLTCEAEGHEFGSWHYPALLGPRPALSEYRHCLRCYLFESRPAAIVDHVGGGEPR